MQTMQNPAKRVAQRIDGKGAPAREAGTVRGEGLLIRP
jgi:hypothetical protein